MGKLNWKEKGLLAVLIMLFLPSTVYSDMQALLRWFGTGTYDVILEFIPSTFSGDGGNSYGPPFRWNIGTFAGVNSGCPGNHNNTVSTFGWNVDWGGGPIDPAQSTMALHLEKGYCINGKYNVEAHIQHVDTNGATHRPFSIAAPWDGSGGSSLRLEGDRINLHDYTGNQRVIFNLDAGFDVMELVPKSGRGMRIRQDTNNIPWLQQLNKAGDQFLFLPYFDESDRLYVSGMVQFSTATPQASLGAAPNGTITYCPDCTMTNPCEGGGTGALAKRLNGVWVCN
jgi:hypothetical protein